MSQTLNRTIAPHILRFFDICFKQGVIDAYTLGDDLESKSFLETRKEDWKFGVLGKPEDHDWQMFRFTLYWWARRVNMKSLCENYIFKIRKIDPVWCFLPYCMRFYLLGIEEWLNYPNPVGIEVFKRSYRAHWDPGSGMKKFTRGDYFSYMHDFAYAYRGIPEEERPASCSSMEAFCQAMFDLPRGF